VPRPEAGEIVATRTEERHVATSTRPAEVVVRVDHKRNRRPSLLTLLVLAAVGVVIFIGLGFANGWLGLNNLFTNRTVDRSAPVILHRLNNLSSYQAASGDFSVVVDVEKDVSILPRFFAGSRVIYSGYGTVGASVDLGALDAAHVTRRADGSLLVTLPQARLTAAKLDPKLSHVMNRDRGLLDRIGGMFVDNPTSEHDLQNAAVVKITRAAKKTNLVGRAERNTETMVKRLAAAAGVSQVDVRFADEPTSQAAQPPAA
jgi:thiamine pyrophosphate-dependent acetolactate synthase large subunit-like protein